MPTHGNTADQALLDSANKFYRAIFTQALTDSRPSELEGKATMIVRSKAKTVEYDWLLNFVTMAPWIGERSIASFKAKNYSVAMVLEEGGTSVKRVDVESDNLGLYSVHFRQMPQAYIKRKRQLLANLLINGATAGNTGYDGVTFFNASHPAEGDEGVQSNTSGGSVALTQTNFDAGVQQMAELLDHNSDPMDIHPTDIVVGPSNYAAARDLFEVSTLTGGGENPVYKSVNVIREPRITTDDWYLLDLSQELKPFILQIADDLELQTLTRADSDYVIMNDAFFYGLRARFAVAYGFWQFAYRGEA